MTLSDIICFSVRNVGMGISMQKGCEWRNTYLVTGATGFIGRNIVAYLLGSECQIYIAVRNREKAIYMWKDEIASGRIILTEWNMKEPLSENIPEIDYLIHAAAICPGKGKTETEILVENVLGIQNVLEYARYKLRRKMIFLSSAVVYGKRVNIGCIPIIESESELSCIKEMDAYGISKLLGEKMILNESGVSDKCKIVRLFKVYGKGTPANEYGDVVSNLLWQAINEKQIIIKGEATNIRNFLYVSDAAEIIVNVLHMDGGEKIYNIGNPTGNYSIYDYALLLAKYTKKDVVAEHRGVENRSAQIPDLEKMACLKKQQWVPFDEGVVEMLNHI